MRSLLLLAAMISLAACALPPGGPAALEDLTWQTRMGGFMVKASLVIEDEGPADRIVFDLEEALDVEAELMVLRVPADWRERTVVTTPDGVLRLEPPLEPELVVDPAVGHGFFGRDRTGISVDGPVSTSRPHHIFREHAAHGSGLEGVDELRPYAAIALREQTLEYAYDSVFEGDTQSTRLYILDLERGRWVQLTELCFDLRRPSASEVYWYEASRNLNESMTVFVWIAFYAALIAV